jgi:urocanate hydratase
MLMIQNNLDSAVAQFPHEFTIQGTPDSVYVAGKYLKGK